MAQRNIELGIDPSKDKKIRARAAQLRQAAEGIEDHTADAKEEIDFLYLTDKEAKKVSKDDLVEGLSQLGLDINPEEYSNAELIEMGRDAALSKE